MDEDEDDYISFGTPLPDLEEETVLRKKAAKELEVRDEKGRQRFHGAFTGGFSAGYFNTVGTKEGWAPTTFVSSRNKTADRVQQNPEDFMDDEDLGEFGIATRRIHTTSKFTDSSDTNKNKRKFTEVDNIIPGEAPLKNLVRPVRESIGVEILTKLGWKLGQGIGPRVKKDSSSTKIYGCSPFPDSSTPEEDDPLAFSYTFAPKDTQADIYDPKDDVFGLGYTGLSKKSILGPHIDSFNPTFTKSWLKKDKKKLIISGQAFGVGALEDDDDDIYSRDDMTQYDFSDLETRKTGQTSEIGSKQVCGSSNTVLEGFCLASQPPPLKKYYPPPDLPPKFRPIRSAMPKVTATVESQFQSRHKMSAEDRSFLLGEKKFQPFQINSEKKKTENKPDTSDKLKTPVVPTTKHSFRPFPNDEPKQQRYEEFLRLQSAREIEKIIQPSSMTEWEKQQELEEFARAAVLFKPLSAALSSKFESRSHLSVEHEVMDALAKAKKEKENSKTSVEQRKLVGLSKRTTSEWHPASLLCKRFNVPNPFPNSSEVSGSQKSKSLFDHISFESKEMNKSDDSPSSTSIISERRASDAINAQPSEYIESSSKCSDTVNISRDNKLEKDSQGPPSESQRPPIDFFKDIFENSSDEEESTTEPSVQVSDSVSKSASISESVEDTLLPTQASNSTDHKPVKESKKGFGVFANLDLDALNRRTPVVKPPDTNYCEIIGVMNTPNNLNKEMEDTKDTAIEPVAKPHLSEDLYGPELPPNYSAPSNSSPSTSERKKHAKHKLKHKHKHKSKKNKKKRSSHKISDDSFDSDEDIPPTVILEKLKKLQKVLKSDL